MFEAPGHVKLYIYNHLVKEALVHVDRDELEEVLVEKRENLDRLEIISKPILNMLN